MTPEPGRVAVLVPYRSDGEARDRNWEFVQAWWARHEPSWQVIAGACPDGAWCKGLAVADALTKVDPSVEVVVVADADVICDGARRAAGVVAGGAAGWAVPHRRVHRLSHPATIRVRQGGDLPPEPTRRRRLPHERPKLGRDVVESYVGTAGGGMVALARQTLRRVPIDPRFTGWGQEDSSWGLALGVMAGPGWRGDAPMWHLWHPPQDRLSRASGSVASLELHHRYRQAGTMSQMSTILAEIG